MTYQDTINRQIFHIESMIGAIEKPAPRYTKFDLETFYLCGVQDCTTTKEFLEVIYDNGGISADEFQLYRNRIFDARNQLTKLHNEIGLWRDLK